MCAGGQKNPSRLLPQDEPSVWYQAAAAASAKTHAEGHKPKVSATEQAQLQAQAEAALEAEAHAFERDLGALSLILQKSPRCTQGCAQCWAEFK